MQVFVRDDLVQVGFTEDGAADVRHSLYLVAEDGAGRRWAHDHARTAHRAADVAEVLEALRVRVARHLAAGGQLAEAHWIEIDPAYGSAAYERLDARGYFRAAERQRARDGGEAVSFDEPGDAPFA